MQKIANQKLSYIPKVRFTQIHWLIIAVLLLGIFFRGTNLDRKVFWGDEASTLSRIAGYTFEEIKEQFSDAYDVGIEDLEKYQQLTPARTSLDVIQGLAAEEPQLPPVYFLGLRFWAQWFGTSLTAVRSFSALISLLAIPCMYWLGRELFTSAVPAWMAMALITISPFHVAYAQEARPQSLWTVTILLSSAALLRALRVNTRSSWSIYTATLALSFYTYLFSALVAIAHGLYVLLNAELRLTKSVRAYLIAAIAAGLLTIPWMIVAVSSFGTLDSGTSWVKVPVSWQDLVRTWLLNISRLWIDFNYSFTYRDSLAYLGIAATTLLVGYAIYFLCRHAPKRIWLFILLLIGVPAIALVLPDLIVGGRRSGVARYLIPSFLGIQLAVAYLLASYASIQVQQERRFQAWQQPFWKLVTASLISIGVLSCIVFSQSPVWWNKYNGTPLPAAADVINQSSHPILITSGVPPLEFMYLIKTDLTFQSPEEAISDGRQDIFVMSRNYSESVLQKVLEGEPDYQVKDSYVWKSKVDPTYEYKIMLWNLAQKGMS